MFSSAQIVGLVVLTLVVIGVAFILMRLDDSIGTPTLAEEAESDSTVAAAPVARTTLPVSGKNPPKGSRRSRH